MALFADIVRFSPTAGGTSDWTYSAAIQGYQNPTIGGMVSGQTYKYRAESADLSQWEVGEGVWNGAILTRVTVLYNSSGGTSKISFTVAPQVAIVAMNADLQNQKRTRTLLTSGSGTYTTPVGCKSIFVRALGGGGGGGGGNSGGATGAPGAATTFGTALLNALGGGAGLTFGNANATTASASGGDINISGNPGMAWGPGTASAIFQGGIGGSGPFGGAGYGGWPGANAGSAAANSGSGGGGGGGANGGNSGAAGAYLEKLITSPLSSYSYSIGGGGNGGAAGGTGTAGGNGGSGIIIIDEFY